MAKQNSWFFPLPLFIIHLEVILTFLFPSHPIHQQDLSVLKSLQSLPSPAYILQPPLNTTVFLLPLLPPNIRLNPWQFNTLQQLPHCAKSRFQSLQWLQGPAWSGSCPLLHPDIASATFLLAIPKHPKLMSTSTLALIVPSIWALSASTLFFKFQLKSHLRGHLRIFSLKQYTHLLKA